MASASLKLSGVTKRYLGVLALDNVDFECRPGKSTPYWVRMAPARYLLGIAGGATEPDEGRVKSWVRCFRGRSAAGAAPGAGDRLSGRFTGSRTQVAENLVLGARDRTAPMSGRYEWAARMLAPYQLDIAPDRQVGQLTPAQRQFLEIVKALISDPRVLLLDEPTASLDASGVERLSGIIRHITAEGRAVVYVSHRLPEILALANRVTILREASVRAPMMWTAHCRRPI